MASKDIQDGSGSLLTREAPSFDIKITWLAISRMFAPLAARNRATVAMAFAILNISREKGTPATKIAPVMGMEPGSLTRLLRKMEKEKIIVRKPDPDDGRSVRIFLTPKGEEMQQIARGYVDSFHSLIEERVPADQLNTFYDVLEEIHGVIEHFSQTRR